jgi:hypothetical protein
MKLRSFAVSVVALLFSLVSAIPARGADKADVYFGYSRVGANLYAANTPAMNGWQAAAHIKPIPFIGIEGDVSHYSQNVNNYSQQVTLVMFGPRVTVHAAGFSVFAHGLGGLAHEHATLIFLPPVGYNATSYAFRRGRGCALADRAEDSSHRRLPGEQRSAYCDCFRRAFPFPLSHWRGCRLPLLAARDRLPPA